MSTETLARLSNELVYSALVVYALAMLAYSWQVAAGRRPAPALVRRSPAVAATAATALGADTLTLQDAPPAVVTASPADPARKAGAIALNLTRLAFVLHLGAVVARGFAAQRPPWGNMYEFSVAGGLVATGAFLALRRRYDIDYLGVLVVPIVLLDLGLAVSVLYTEAEQVLPILRSYWLVIHVAAAIVSTGAFTVGAAFSTLQIVRKRAEDRAPDGLSAGWLARTPSSAALDRLAYKVHAFVFPVWTFAIIAGAIWAENAWGRYWGWDPKETWAFITWVVYAAYLHARATAGWNGNRASAVALVGYGCLLFNYFGVNFFLVGMHSYAGVG